MTHSFKLHPLMQNFDQVLESCPDVEGLRAQMEDMKARLGKLAELEDAMKTIKSKTNEKYEELALIALELGVLQMKSDEKLINL